MARRRSKVQHSVWLAALVAGAPLAAQSTNTTTPPAGTANPATTTPAPAGNAVGPPQLRDFNLDGRVTRPAETPPPVPAPAPGTTVVTPPAPTRAAPATRTNGETPEPAQRAAPREAPLAPANDPAPDAVALDPVGETAPPPLPDFDQQQSPAVDPIPSAPATEAPVTTPWPWLAALLAAVLAGGFLWWRRQHRGSSRFAADHADGGAMVAPRAAPDPLPTNRPAPGAAPTPAPPPTPAPAAPVEKPARPVAPVGIVASGLKPRIELALVPILAEVDAGQGAAVTVEIVVNNRGSAPARDVIVDARLLNAAANVNNAVGQFFQQPTTAGQQVPVIPPMSSVTVRMRLDADTARLAPIVVEGRKLLVPVVAVNAQYRWSGGALKESVSFLVGRGEAEAAKLAPFRLDLGARRWSGLAARLHSNGLEPAPGA